MDNINFDALLERLIAFGGATAEKGFEITMRLVIAEGIMELVYFVVLLVIFFFLYNKLKKVQEEDFIDGFVEFFIYVGLIFIIFLSIVFLTSGIKYLIVPEWYAIQKLVTLVVQ